MSGQILGDLSNNRWSGGNKMKRDLLRSAVPAYLKKDSLHEKRYSYIFINVTRWYRNPLFR